MTVNEDNKWLQGVKKTNGYKQHDKERAISMNDVMNVGNKQ